MSVNPRWFAYWVFVLVVLVGGGESVALLASGRGDTLSEQVWFLLGLSPWIKYPALAAFGAGAAWMAVHFFGRRT